MDKISIIKKTLNLPMELIQMGQNTLELLEATEFFELKETLTEIEIEAHLKDNPKLISYWQQYSDNQRCIPVWSLRLTKLSGEIEVIHEDESGVNEAHMFTDIIKASAFYIKRELESLRKIYFNLIAKHGDLTSAHRAVLNKYKQN